MVQTVIHLADGRTLVSGAMVRSNAPTNLKAGSVTGGNTLIWNSRSGETKLVSPRQTKDIFESNTGSMNANVPRTSELPDFVRAGQSDTRRAATLPLAVQNYKAVSRFTTDTNYTPCETVTITPCQQGAYPFVSSQNRCDVPTGTTYVSPYGY